MEITCGVWQVWITDRDPNRYRLAWEGFKRSEALKAADELRKRGHYGVEVVKKSRRLPCIQ